MSGFLTTRGAHRLATGLDWTSATIKVMLMDSSFSPSKADKTVDTINAHEIANITGYTGGFGGSGRKTLASAAVTEDDTNHWAKLAAANLVWSALATGDTIGQYCAIIHEITNDAGSDVLGYVQIASGNTPTNGSDVDLNWGANGLFTDSV